MESVYTLLNSLGTFLSGTLFYYAFTGNYKVATVLGCIVAVIFLISRCIGETLISKY